MGGVSRCSVESFFCLTVPEIFVGEPFILCFRKCLVAKKFMDEREGELSRFPPEIFCLTVPKNFVAEPCIVSLISGTEKIYASEVYVTIFRRIFFCLTVPKNFVREPFCASQNF